jgi:glycosyltransferase involved in cell wall biosynthesis
MLEPLHEQSASFETKKIIYYIGKDIYFFSHRLPTAKAALDTGYAIYVVAKRTLKENKNSSAKFNFYPRWFGRDNFIVISMVAGFLQLLFLTLKLRPSIIHIVGLRYAPLGLIVSLLRPSPRLILSINGLGYLFTNPKNILFYRSIRWMILKLFAITSHLRKIEIYFQNKDDLVVFTSFRQLERAEIGLVRGSGIDTKRYTIKPMPQGVVTFGVACRMIRIKGIEDIIATFTSLIRDGVSVRLLLAGDTDKGNPESLSEDYLRAISKTNNNIQWLNYVHDIEGFWSNCHVALLGSHGGEGLPMSLLIPAAMGRAIITTDTNGNRDLVENGLNGFLYNPYDPNGLKEAIIKILCCNLEKTGNESRSLVIRKRMSASAIREDFNLIYRNYSP